MTRKSGIPAEDWQHEQRFAVAHFVNSVRVVHLGLASREQLDFESNHEALSFRSHTTVLITVL